MAFLRDTLDEARVIWWRFFDWVAVVEWRQLIITWLLIFILAIFAKATEPAGWFIILSFAIKVLAGGKRKAELAAHQASREAGNATLERRLVEQQMATLQAQIEPHFLFNTLALIGQLIETNPPEAARIHNHLIDYLRATLPQMRSSGGATLGRQVNLSKAYLAIMQARMKDRLKVSFEVPDYLDQACFPPMMLQTLIENSIKHGLEPKIEGGRIDIRAQLVDGTLQVEVRDNGVGFDPHSGEGVGLSNIRERLRLLHGERAQLLIEMPVEGGTVAAIHLPFSLTENC
jgi:hypothetical protein